MNTQNARLPELLCPAGSFEALCAAVKGGADAVYFGSTLFNARMNAKNFTREDVKRAVDYCHERGVLCYVTLNTALIDKQYKDALLLAEYLYKTGVDALIVSDFGVAAEIHKYFPDFLLHASTQTSGHNSKAAEFLKDIGFSRMVIAREASKENISLTIRNSPIEIEVFVHGALCVSCSGQCLFSSIVGGRSGNRGECAQPCRLPYNSRYPISLKDLCLADHITELYEMGISSLKIEGRMKTPDYVYAVTSVYRVLLDEGRNATAEEIKYLADVFSRNGFTDGYFTGNINNSMLGTRAENAQSKAAVMPKSISSHKIAKKEPIVLPERKYSLPQDFSSYRALNSKFEYTGKKAYRSACFLDISVIPEKKHTDYFDIIYIPLDKFVSGEKIPSCVNGIIFPPVIYDSEYENVSKMLEKAKKSGALHALVGNVGHISLAKDAGFVLHGSHRLNICSGPCASVFADLDEIVLSAELLLAQARDIKAQKSIIIYGRLPLMTLEKPVGTKLLTDRRKVSFPVISEGRNDIIINSVPTYMADKKDELSKLRGCGEFFIFTNEGKRETENTIDSYMKGYTTKREIRRLK